KRWASNGVYRRAVTSSTAREERGTAAALFVIQDRPRPETRSLVAVGLEQAWKHRGAFDSDGIESFRIQAEELQDGGSHLTGFHKAGIGTGPDAGVGYQQHDVGIVVSEATMLGLFFETPGVNHANVRY